MPMPYKPPAFLLPLSVLAIAQGCSGGKIRPKGLEFSGRAGGCGNFFVYKYARNQLAGLVG